ncbi:MAG: FAD:protein FMN transferase [Clostridia bacterium]|nr:FAD:protein FMN transferase [Clostridia bacterium]
MKRYAAIAVLFFFLCSLCACTAEPSLPSRTDFALDTVVTITLYDTGKADAEEVLCAAFAEIERLEALLSATRENSDVMRLNTAGGQPVTVAPETAEVLALARRYAQLSEGALDITIRSASVLWDFTVGTIPEAAALQQAVSLIDYRGLHLVGHTVTLEKGAVDLGGIAKGYIADRVASVLRGKGVRSALIDLGGNIVAIGNKEGAPFRIGIKDPSATDSLCAVIEKSDMSVVTSGIYERGFDQDGVRYHHLLDPATGMPVQNTLASVTIVAEKSADADALSTACFVMGEERARTLIESLSDTEALFVRRDGTVSATAGLDYTTP